MAEIADGDFVEVQGSGKKPYVLKNIGGVYSCSCPAWLNQSFPVEKRTCKHLRKLRGDDLEQARVGSAVIAVKSSPAGEEDDESKSPPLLLAHSWDNESDLSGWWISEKLDGVRAYWDGKRIVSRLGNEYFAPDWFLEDLPSVALDGELWITRKAFQKTVGVVRRKDKSELWREVRYLVFDAPSMKGSFEERMAFLQETFREKPIQYAKLHEQDRCVGVDHLRSELRRVEALGGEGLMLRQPGSKYEVGRSTTLLKIKTFYDAEALVLGHQAGKGRHEGRMGALAVRLADGTTFSVGTGFSDKERGNPPSIGSTITFRYQELSNDGVPRFPSFVRMSDATLSDGTTVAPVEKAKEGKIPDLVSSPGPVQAKSVRYFEYTDGSSSKFWEIATAGAELRIRYGKIGTTGVTQLKTLSDESAAKKQGDKLIAEKTGKGYLEKLS